MAGTLFSGNTSSYQTLLAQLQTVLTDPLTERCVVLSQLLQEAPLKELHCIFSSLVENIFGYQTGVDWGLLTLEKTAHARDFEALRQYLGSEGPLIKAALRITEDGSAKFQFPILCLPVPTQLLLKEGKVPPLYASKLQPANPGYFPSLLQLNAYEFYLFHFTYFIVNSTVKSASSTVNQQDTLYAHVLEDYLGSFLPVDNRAIPLFQPPSPIRGSALSSNYGSPDYCSRPHSLLKKDALVMLMSPSSTPPHGGAPAESWHSETFILVLREMLLGQSSTEQRSSMVLLPKTFLASHYHVWMVRITVKHLHFFFNSSLYPSQPTGHGQILIDSLGRLKSLGITQLIQKEIYCFLKSTFDHWPLDASFRVPLETYLSYIQPWRYIRSDLEPSVWRKFINENLVFYTTIFQQILNRFLRMDLSCPKNAYMLFRLTKVICTEELRELIMQAEKGSPGKPPSGMSTFLHNSPEKFSIHKPNEEAPPLFSQPVFALVTRLLTAIKTAREKISVQSPFSVHPSKSFFLSFCSLFETSSEAIHSDNNSPSDMNKIDSYLELSSKSICIFFKEVIPPPMNLTPPKFPFDNTMTHKNNINLDPSSPSAEIQNLSTSGRSFLLDRKCRPNVEYKANPDLQPVRTYEVEFLVHQLNDLAQAINEMYGNKISELYYHDSILGKLSRKILYPPTTYLDIHKSKDMQCVSTCPVHLPPRVNLRILAHKQLVCYFVLYMLVSYLVFNCDPILSFFFLCAFVLLVFLVTAVLSPVPLPLKED